MRTFLLAVAMIAITACNKPVPRQVCEKVSAARSCERLVEASCQLGHRCLGWDADECKEYVIDACLQDDFLEHIDAMQCDDLEKCISEIGTWPCNEIKEMPESCYEAFGEARDGGQAD